MDRIGWSEIYPKRRPEWWHMCFAITCSSNPGWVESRTEARGPVGDELARPSESFAIARTYLLEGKA